MGAPLGFERTVTRGIISNTERYISFTPYTKLIQTDAAINPGNSGGPLVNEEGEIIGINSYSAFFSENIGFAIPSEMVQKIVNKLIKDRDKKQSAGINLPGKVQRAYMGVVIQPLKDFTNSKYINAKSGIFLGHIEPNSPADKAGLLPSDIILSINDKTVNCIYETDIPLVLNFVSELPIDILANLVIRRGSEDKKIVIVPTTKDKHHGDDFDCNKWGMTVKEITKFSDPILYYYKNKGVYIKACKDNGNAYNCYFTNNDIIVKINDNEINAIDDIKKVYTEYEQKPKGKKKALLEIIRQGYPMWLVLNYEQEEEK